VTIRNLGALCVLPKYRDQSVRLMRAALADRSLHLTDLSPSGAVVPLNERFGFARLDTTTALIPALPRLDELARTRVIIDADEIAQQLTGRELEIYRDHRQALAARHVVLERWGHQCYVIWRHDRRKQLPLFASLLYTSDPDALLALLPALSVHLLRRHGVLAILAELRLIGRQPRSSIMLKKPRPKMFRSQTLSESSIDYLYSELTCVAW